MHDFYPRSPCGERLSYAGGNGRSPDISIHALLAESDAPSSNMPGVSLNFYPRSPCGERRWLRCWQLAARDISIHALLAESDLRGSFPGAAAGISIHALLAESDMGVLLRAFCYFLFLSTLSLRRATHWQVGQKRFLQFLSTLSLRRATPNLSSISERL